MWAPFPFLFQMLCCLQVLHFFFLHRSLHLAFVLYGEILFLILNTLNLPPNLSMGCTSKTIALQLCYLLKSRTNILPCQVPNKHKVAKVWPAELHTAASCGKSPLHCICSLCSGKILLTLKPDSTHYSKHHPASWLLHHFWKLEWGMDGAWGALICCR